MTGVVNSVSTWLTSKPPTTAMPSGWRSSAPVPKPSISGIAPSSAARVVMMIGRNRVRQASWIASSGARPRLRCASQGEVDHQDAVLLDDADQQHQRRSAP